MNTKSLLIGLFLGLFINVLSFAQDKHTTKENTASLVQDDLKVKFDGRFAILLRSDEINNYYLVDFTRFADKFEKVYFMNLSFRSNVIVNSDSDLTHDFISFSANKKFPVSEVVKLFDDLKKETLDSAKSKSEVQKAKWMKENDKYK